MKTRRDIFRAAGAAAAWAAWPSLAQPARARVCWLSPTRAADGSVFLDALRAGLKEFGHAEGSNLALDAFWGEDSPPRTQQMIADAVARSPDVIVAQGATALAASKATQSIPIVFGYSGDPVEAGLVASLARPGRNCTGVTYLALELVGKRLEILKEALPRVRRLAVVANPQHAGDASERRVSQVAAASLGIGIEYHEARNPEQLEQALLAIEKARADAVMLFPVQNVINQRARIAAWSVKTQIPAVSGWSQFAEGGNFMSYGPNLRDASRRLAFFVDRVLKGTRPADLPVELPTRVELVVNLRAARQLGVSVPRSVLLRADTVIE